MTSYDMYKNGWGIMGQKGNPLGFRLGVTQGHHSLLFAHPKIPKVYNKIKKYEIVSGIEYKKT